MQKLQQGSAVRSWWGWKHPRLACQLARRL